MKKVSKAEKLSKGLWKQSDANRRDYAVKEINKLSKAELWDIKFQYEATINTTLPWTWLIALYGVLFTLLLQTIASTGSILIPIVLFVVSMAIACILAIRLYKVLSGQRYLLGYIDNRLAEFKAKNKNRP